MTIAKILPGIPRSNPLVRQYYQLKKEQNGFVNKFTTILARVHERMDSFKAEPKKQRKEQIKENSEKPTLSEITEFIETLTHSKADMGR